jgi:hypothetical protein
VNCASWEDAKVILADEAKQVVAFGKSLVCMRRRRKLGMHLVKTEISEEAVELLAKRGYLLTRTPASMGLAITALLSDLVLDAA